MILEQPGLGSDSLNGSGREWGAITVGPDDGGDGRGAVESCEELPEIGNGWA